MQSNAIAMWVAKKKFKRVFCIGQDWNFGHESCDAFKRKLAEIAPDIKIVGDIYHKPGEKEYAPYISQALSAKADVIFTGDWGNDLAPADQAGRLPGTEGSLCHLRAGRRGKL